MRLLRKDLNQSEGQIFLRLKKVQILPRGMTLFVLVLLA